ncbi:MAG TPA: SGNH/GDSL hydrolase family protein [Puia sp.]|nr:SGNH/GDSL hydrolase family protein [Puia sp.]
MEKKLFIVAPRLPKQFFIVALGLLGSLNRSVAQIQPLTPFQPGERVVFVGNSITEQGYYESYIWLYYMLHFPGRRITVYNGGIGGDRAKNILDRFDDDVLPKKPTTICLTFGMNDSGYFEFLWANADSAAKARVKESSHYFGLIREKLLQYTSAKKIMISSSLYDETVKNPKNYFPKKSEAMQEIAAFQEKAAQDEHWGFVDFLRPMTEITLREQKKDSTFTLTGSDRIHPGNAGHFVMAWLFLKQQGLAGQPVADMVIDAAARKTERSDNCRISAVSVSPGDLQFDYLAFSLPFPQDSVPRLWDNPHRQTEALDVIPFNEEMNREKLTVKGLGEGNFSLMMDGRPIGRWTGTQLAKGIDLATLKNTPEYDQAMSVLWLNEERMGLEAKLRAYYWLQFECFRDIGLMYADNDAASDSVNRISAKNWAVASKKDNYRAARYAVVREGWQKEMDALIEEIYTANQPRKHTIRLKAL